MTSPFEPHDVTWSRVSPRLVTAMLVPATITLGIPAIVGVVLAVIGLVVEKFCELPPSDKDRSGSEEGESPAPA